MWENDTLGGAKTTLATLDELLAQYDTILNGTQEKPVQSPYSPESATSTYTPTPVVPATPPTFSNDDAFYADLSAYMENDPDLAEILRNSQTASPQPTAPQPKITPFVPPTLEDIDRKHQPAVTAPTPNGTQRHTSEQPQYQRPLTVDEILGRERQLKEQAASLQDNGRQTSAPQDMSNYQRINGQPQPQTVATPDKYRFTPQPVPETRSFTPPPVTQPSYERQPVKEPYIPLQEQIAQMTGKTKSTTTEPVINEKQLKSLSRKHLLIMIYELQGELIQIKAEREAVDRAYQAGLAQSPQRG
jgi:hypothetical protein